MLEKIKRLFKKEKKKTYVVPSADWTGPAYWVLIFSLCVFFIVTAISNQKVALPFLLMIPSLIGIFFILFFLPVRAITFFLTEGILRILLFHTPKNMPAETVIVIGKTNYFQPVFWTSPNYDTDLLLIVHYLKMLGKPFSIYYNVTLETLDKIMENSEIRIVYIFGHGRRHSYALDRTTAVDYCRYDNTKYKKDFVYQIHCNGGRGKSLVEYVVPQENQAECLPEHGLMTNLTIDQMFIDKIIKLKNYTGVQAFLSNAYYSILTVLIPIAVFILWGIIFLKMVAAL